MANSRQLHLGAFMRPVSLHTGAWRYPGAYPDANFNFRHLKGFAQKLEAAKFDAFFMADHLAVMNMPMAALRRSAGLPPEPQEAPPGKRSGAAGFFGVPCQTFSPVRP